MQASNRRTMKKLGTPAVSALEVLLGNDLVGTLTHLPDDRTIWAFDPGYAQNPLRPTLSLSFKTASGGVSDNTRPTRLKVPPYFSNLLPEGHLREYLADKGPVHPEREFFLLWLLGKDLPGAIRIRPLGGNALPPTAAAAAKADPETADQVLRFSLAGVQLKFSALLESDGGLTIPLQGVGGDWIAKFPSNRFSAVPENEYVMLTLAAATGISVPELRLVSLTDIHNVPAGAFTGSGKALVERRFDRSADGARIHMEDFAQVFNLYPHRKYGRASYEDIARVLWAETGETGIREFTRRLAVTALIGNGDMHLKNWSLLYPDRRTPVLSPAYDFVSTITYEFDPELALSLGGTKAMEKVDEELFRKFAQRADLPDRIVVETAQETAERLREAWVKNSVVDLLPADLRKAVSAHLDRVPLGRR
jgi:serine/threonine-protein kinase HipA